MKLPSAERLRWLTRRLSRISAAEIPYRVGGFVRTAAQSRGFWDARQPPPLLAKPGFGAAWAWAPALSEADGRELEADAQTLLARGPRIFGLDLDFSAAAPDWNADPRTGHPVPLDFGLSIDFRHMAGDIDIKFLWELNRHLWWVRLAQAYAHTGHSKYLHALGQHLARWLESCPYPLGPNWSSPVEQGIRLINWSLVWHLIGGANSALFVGSRGQALRQNWLCSIYQHMRFASDNYSFHSSGNNHLLGEAAGVFVAACTWDCWPASQALRNSAHAILEREAQKQFSSDGANWEQATGYHGFALQFVLAAGLAGRAAGHDFSDAYWHRVESAMVFLGAQMDCQGATPGFGDSDDGEVFRLGYGKGTPDQCLLAVGATLFQRADLQAKACAVNPAADKAVSWLTRQAPPPTAPDRLSELPRHFPEGGLMLMGSDLHRGDEVRVSFDCGPLGCLGIAGHGHADALSVLLSVAGEALLLDSGTYCYNSAPHWRKFFRGTSAHNTLRVDGEDQSIYGASFLWLQDVNTRIHAVSEDGAVIHASHDGYTRLKDPVHHHRRVSWNAEAGCLTVEDWLECQQTHGVELFWHGTPDGQMHWDGAVQRGALVASKNQLQLELSGAELQGWVSCGVETDQELQGWASHAFYEKRPAPVLTVAAQLKPGQILRTVLRIRPR
ncbi:alginate lyase family protein [Paucibacter sp. DJ2R-2]|uniref:alginate lyase family protein n=1 Tax=Paucibacter sp. DJ2R-2 TaxID=2893558 RepID=UPI0021E40D6C|nr:alginate lyase family protein [Paucibacter sp. DJ2R-2]MCV2422812.1 heparinase II/III family protein [Paucibacter sp. DJ4R-1]MCV2441047.1 heparinase II/III family protein [Paucibacter sp. DJ2R-2]